MKKGGNIVADAKLTLTLDDKMSIGLTNIRNSINSLTKDVEIFDKKLNQLGNKRFTLNIDTSSSLLQLEKTKQAFDNITVAADKNKMQLNGLDYSKAMKGIGKFREEIEETYKQYVKLADTIDDSNASSISNKNIFQMIANQGMQAFSAIGSTFLNSRLEPDSANAIGGLFGGMAQGALTGFTVGNGAGALVGAVIGGITGIVTSITENFSELDDYFKDIYNKAVEEVSTEGKNDILSGSEIAASRESVNKRLNDTLGEGNHESFNEDLKRFIISTPLEYENVVSMASDLLSNGFNKSETLQGINHISEAGVAMNMSADELAEITRTIGKINLSEGNITDNIDVLNKYGIDAYSLLGVEKDKLQKDISSGKLSGEDIADGILLGLRDKYGGAIRQEADTFRGKENTLKNWEETFQAASGEAYNEKMGEHMTKQSLWYSQNDEELTQVYSLLGEYQAYLDTAEVRYERAAMEDLINGELIVNDRNLSQEYRQALNAGDEKAMTELVAMAKIQGEANWINSPEYKDKLNTQEKLLLESKDIMSEIRTRVEDIQRVEGLKNLGLAAGPASMYRLQQTSGIPYIVDQNGNVVDQFGRTPQSVMPDLSLSEPTSYIDPNADPESYAVGISRVPYDGYRALLHEGERVVTASKAKESERAKGGVNIGNINITASGAINDDEMFARMLASQLEKALAAYAV